MVAHLGRQEQPRASFAKTPRVWTHGQRKVAGGRIRKRRVRTGPVRVPHQRLLRGTGPGDRGIDPGKRSRHRGGPRERSNG